MTVLRVMMTIGKIGLCLGVFCLIDKGQLLILKEERDWHWKDGLSKDYLKGYILLLKKILHLIKDLHQLFGNKLNELSIKNYQGMDKVLFNKENLQKKLKNLLRNRKRRKRFKIVAILLI